MNSIHCIRFLLLALLLVSCSPGKKAMRMPEDDIITPPSDPGSLSTSSNHATDNALTKYDGIQIKYARYLGTDPGQIQNLRLYKFIDQWLTTPYKWGGTNEKGIDCSAFMQRLLAEVYNIRIPRTSVQQFLDDWVDRFGSTKYLSEGDLVFFRTMDDKIISHVGMYLKNRNFVNSSSSSGVSIANLDDAYWKRCFVAAGRIKTTLSNGKK